MNRDRDQTKLNWTLDSHPDATMLLQTTLLLNMHAEDSGGNEVAKGDKADHSI